MRLEKEEKEGENKKEKKTEENEEGIREGINYLVSTEFQQLLFVYGT